MDVTNKPSRDDAAGVTITPEMLDAHKPEELRRLEDVDGKAVFAYTVNAYDDDLLLDCFDAAAGAFLGEDAFDGAELMILLDKAGRQFEWQVSGPGCPTTIGRRYRLPEDTANAIRFLENYMELDMRLPLTPVLLSDSVDIGQEGIRLNGQPMALLYPYQAIPVEVRPDPSGNCMGWVMYEAGNGTLLSEEIGNIVLGPR